VTFHNIVSSVRWIALLFLLVATGVRMGATIHVTLASSPASPQPVGTTVTWTATISDTASGGHELQFSVAPSGGPAAIVRDFHTSTSFPWTPSYSEGTYTISVVARNVSTGQTASNSAAFTITSRLVSGHAAVNSTRHPLVALFSGPACLVPNLMRIRFTPTSVPPGGISASMTTNPVPCRFNATSPFPDASSMNFYIAGMYPSRQYLMHYETVSPQGALVRAGTDLAFTTGTLPGNIVIPATTVPIPAQPPTSVSTPILLHDYLPQSGTTIVPAATDLSGNTLWYYPTPVSLLTRTEVGGNMFIIYAGNTNLYYQLLREIDLAGNIVLETNVARVNEQLVAAGRRTINAFHHEARRLPNGYIAVLGSDEMLVTNAQGGTVQNPVDVLGAQVIVLDQNLQLKWAWDAFDFMDINRAATLGEVCYRGRIGCPIFFLASNANDWMHANSIQQAPDGNIIVSLRHQDWIIKINYASGTGDGHVMWRMGYQGDFTLTNPPTSPLCTTPDQQDAYQWFGHQHDANFQLGGNAVLSTFDNGNLRLVKCDTNGHSRGYVLSVDEAQLQATLTLLSDLGNYSVGLGTAELIPGSSNYHFELGWILPGAYSTSIEVDPSALPQFEMREQNVTTYRSYRMQDLYTPALQ
jgi:arylsulfate sulfotransferase